MRAELLHYYERELGFIRKLAGEFGEKYPEVAGRLALGAGGGADPHAERLIEAFAMLAARIQMRLDDDFSEISAALLGILYPHYLAPLPSAAIVRLEGDRDLRCPPEGLRVERHALLHGRAVGGVRCRFRTAYPVTLWPIAVESVEIVPGPALGVPLGPGVRSALRIRLRALHGARFADLRVERLRFFLGGQPGAAQQLYELLLRDPRGLAVQSSPGERALLRGADSVRAVGFGREEGLLVYPPESFLGYRILQEYFAYPDKFGFVELCAPLPRQGETADLCVLLAEPPGELELALRPADLLLGCTPAVNLFEMTADPIRITQHAVEYPVVPDARNPRAYEVYAITRATSTERGSGRVTRFEPIYAARHGRSESGAAYWHAVRRAARLRDERGTDVFLSLVDERFDPRAVASEVLHVEALCSNRDLPARLPLGDPRGDFEVEGQPAVARALCVRGPTASVPAPAAGGSSWRLVSHLALGHLSLCGEEPALEALREILKLYDFVDSAGTRQRIAGLSGLRTRPVIRRIRRSGQAGFARGTEVELLFDAEQYAGSGVFLMASVLEVFFGLYASLNSFTQTLARTRLREGVLKRWPPRAGEIALL